MFDWTRSMVPAKRFSLSLEPRREEVTSLVRSEPHGLDGSAALDMNSVAQRVSAASGFALQPSVASPAPHSGLALQSSVAPAVGARRDGAELCFWYHALDIAQATASCQYRIGNHTEVLRGATAVVSETLPSRVIARKTALIMARPFVDGARAKALAAYRRRGLRLVGDFDDLLFWGSPGSSQRGSAQTARPAVLAQRRAVYRASLGVFDAFTVATEPLAEHLRELCPGVPVHVVPNGVSLRWASRSRLLYPLWTPGAPKVICYLPGSPSHDADFAAVAPVLAAFLRDHRDVRLEIVGPLEWDTAGFPMDRVVSRRRVPFDYLAAWLASSWVNLAPLHASEFNRCKSSVKYLEAAVMGCPTVATPIPDFERHRVHGLLLARSSEEWYLALSSLLDDDYRMMMGRRAQSHVLSHATAEQSVDALLGARQAWGEPRQC